MEKKHTYYDLNLLLPKASNEMSHELIKLIESLVIDGYKGFALTLYKELPVIETIRKFDIAEIMAQATGKSLTLRESMDLSFSEIEQYTRITIEVDNMIDIGSINKAYDIIALRPINEKAFIQCCKSGIYII